MVTLKIAHHCQVAGHLIIIIITIGSQRHSPKVVLCVAQSARRPIGPGLSLGSMAEKIEKRLCGSGSGCVQRN